MLSLRKALLNPYLLGSLVGWLWLMVDGWTTHLKNMLVKFDHFLKFRGENKNIFETPHLSTAWHRISIINNTTFHLFEKRNRWFLQCQSIPPFHSKTSPQAPDVFWINPQQLAPGRCVVLDFLLEDAKPHLSWVGSSPTRPEKISPGCLVVSTWGTCKLKAIRFHAIMTLFSVAIPAILQKSWRSLFVEARLVPIYTVAQRKHVLLHCSPIFLFLQTNDKTTNDKTIIHLQD